MRGRSIPGAAVAAAISIASVLSACGADEDGDAGSGCDMDAGVLPTRVVVAEGAECSTQRLAVPVRESLACGELPAGFGGARVAFVGRPSTRWTAIVARTDGAPGAICAAVLDDACRCERTPCTDSTQRELTIDFGIVERDTMEVVVPAGTYSIELCTR